MFWDWAWALGTPAPEMTETAGTLVARPWATCLPHVTFTPHLPGPLGPHLSEGSRAQRKGLW